MFEVGWTPVTRIVMTLARKRRVRQRNSSVFNSRTTSKNARDRVHACAPD